MKMLTEEVLEFCVMVFAVFLILFAVRQNQLGPHRVKVSCGGTIWSDVIVTNPTYYTSHTVRTYFLTGVSNYVVWTTNEYWHTWRIFK